MDHATRTFVVVGIGLILGGVFFVWTGQRRRRSIKRFNARATTTQAQVLELRRHEIVNDASANSHWFAPLVRFALPDGRVVEAETMTGSNPPPAQVGQVIAVRFDPDQPTRVNLAGGPAAGTLLGWVHTGVGVGLIGFGAVGCLVGYAISRLP